MAVRKSPPATRIWQTAKNIRGRSKPGNMKPAENNPLLIPPGIEPAPESTARPLWSVMIPTFNCASYLRQTLESVLTQDRGPEQMQIEVVDDCSTKDDPEAVVRRIGQGRVAFFRKPKNEGAIANFN